MTHSGGKPHTNVGDRGQRFEVTYLDEATQKRKVCGWAGTAEGAAGLAEGIELHPGWSQPQIWDRHARQGGDPLVERRANPTDAPR